MPTVRSILARVAVTAALGLAAGAAAAPANDDCTNAKAIDVLPFQDVVDTTGATGDATDPAFGCFGGGVSGPSPRTVWYRVTAPEAMALSVDTFDTFGISPVSETELAAYRGTCGSLTQIACNVRDFDDVAQSDFSRMLVTMEAGETILIAVVQAEQDPPGDVYVTAVRSPVFQVSTEDPASLSFTEPVVAMRPGGDFLVVWHGDDQVTARKFAADGSGGPTFKVNTSGLRGYRPDVASDGLGNFVVAWGDSSGVFAQRFDGSGAPLGGEVAVGPRAYPDVDVGADAAGNFVVVWGDTDVSARRFDATGAPLGPAFTVASGSVERYPTVAMAATGAFVVAWSDQTTIGSDSGRVIARHYDPSGAPTGPPFMVNETTTGLQGNTGPAVSMDAAGNFVVVWGDQYYAGDCENCLRARRYDPSANALGGEFRVNEPLGGGENYWPAVAHDAGGGFVVSWNLEYYGPAARRFDAAGTPRGPQFLASHLAADYQYYSDVAAGGSGFVVVWDHVPVGSDTLVYGRRFPAQAAPACTQQPRPACRRQTVAKGGLTIVNKDPDRGDRLTWKWVKGEATTVADFGDPLGDDSYTLCVYDDPYEWATRASVAGGGECAGAPCWKSLGSTGFRYLEKQALLDGVQKLVLKAGGDGAAKIVFKGKGRRLQERPYGPYANDVLPLDPPVTVQLVSSTGACWEAVYDAGIARNDATKFIARPD